MTHPARETDFGTLRDALQQELARGAVFVCKSGPLELYHYSNGCVYDRLWNPWTLMARGLVLDTEARQVVATPFPKFFNYGEQGGLSLPDEPFEAYEKVDGSLIIAFWHRDRWILTTKGAFDQPQAQWAAGRWAQLHTAGLDRRSTLLFEAIYRANRIVISYPFEDLVLIGGYNGDGREYRRPELQSMAHEMGCRTCAVFPFDSVDRILAAASKLHADHEGFVARFENGFRVKIKGEAYRRIHSLVCGITPLGIWGLLSSNSDLAAIRRDIPEEFWTDFDVIVEKLNGEAGRRIEMVEQYHRTLADRSDKELGLMLAQLPAAVRPFIFVRRKRGPKWHLEDRTTRESLFRTFRPAGNVLEGYSPSRQVRALEQDN